MRFLGLRVRFALGCLKSSSLPFDVYSDPGVPAAFPAFSALSAFLLRRSETDDPVLLAMVRPEIFAVECQRTRMKGNSSEIL